MGNDASRVAVVDVCRGSLVRGEEREGSYAVTHGKGVSFGMQAMRYYSRRSYTTSS